MAKKKKTTASAPAKPTLSPSMQAVANAGLPVSTAPTPKAKTVSRVDRYGRTVEVFTEGPMSGTIVGTNGILFEPAPEAAQVPETTTRMAPKGITGLTSTMAPDGTITYIPTARTPASQKITVSPTGQITYSALDVSPAGPTLAKDVFVKTLGQFFPQKDLTAGWMESLYDVVSGYYKSGVSIPESLNLALREARTNPKLAPFANRFKGIAAIEDLKAAGKPIDVPTIAEYVESENTVADLMTQVGLGDLATTDEIANLLGKGQSVSTIGNKINQVFNRIDLAPQAIKDTLGRYFPTIDRTRLARTILLGERGVKELVDELAGLEVLAAAEQQGVGALGAAPVAGGTTRERAQELARAGVTYGTAMPKFARVRQATPVEAKLAGISGVQSIGQAGVEQAELLGRAKELEQIEKLSEQEIARFQARSGAMQPGLASQRRANRAF